MPAVIADLAASPQLATGALLYAALALYAAAVALALLRTGAGRAVLGIGIALHLAATSGRGWIIEFFPLTNKLESFSAASLALALVTVATWREVRLYVVPLLVLACIALSAALLFPLEPSYPPPLMRTIWYPLHVPLSFLAYAVWAAAAVAGLVWLREPDSAWLDRVNHLALQGFGLWSLSMICGGVWGVLAWGAYFMWDVKIIWSVILWFHYASFIHLRFTPSLDDRPWIRPALALLGLVWVIIAYVGTSFLFGRSSHAW
jgi:ABC-type transport system involved in cytochrome c biogenesis permease subunit